MAERTEHVVRRELRSPRSAAIAGIIYSLLMFTGMSMAREVGRLRTFRACFSFSPAEPICWEFSCRPC